MFYVIQAPWSVPFRRFAHAMLSDVFLPFQVRRAEDLAFYEVKVLLAFAGQGPSSNAFGCRSPPPCAKPKPLWTLTVSPQRH